jgi:ligand-binding sensor domain-containing protein/signal transduction histidine kinase
MKLFCLILTIVQLVLPSNFIFPTPRDYTFRQLRIEDGLSQSTVFASLQDKTGFMWFGTSSGLNRYDGYNFKVFMYDPGNTSSLSDDRIVSLMEDSDRKLWIGTVNGNVNRYDPLTDSFTHINIANFTNKSLKEETGYYDYPMAFSRNHGVSITSIAEDSDGNIWIGTWGKGIVVIDKTFKRIDHFFNSSLDNSVLLSNRIMKIIMDEDNVVWIGTFGGGLSKAFKDEAGKYSFETYPYEANNSRGISDSKIITLLNDSKGNLWIGTYYGGLNLLKKQEKKIEKNHADFVKFHPNGTDASVSHHTIMALCEDKQGNIWIGTMGAGLDRYNPDTQRFINFRHNALNPNSLADNDVLSLSVDRAGLIWAGSHLGEGITKIQRNPAKFNTFSHQQDNSNSLNDNVVWSIYEDSDKILWVATYRGGLNRIDREKNHFTFIQHSPKNSNSISSNHLRAVAEDNFGNLWIGTYNTGLNLIDKKTFNVRRYNSSDSKAGELSANQVQSILIDNDEYWIGTFGGGLNFVKTPGNPFTSKLVFEHFKSDPDNPKSLSDNRVYKVFKDRRGTIWVGTFGGGLNKMDRYKKEFEHFRHVPDDNESLPDDKVLSIAEDSDGFILVGTYGGALSKLNPVSGKFERYSRKHGFNASVVYGILEDDNKNLWLSTDNGIFRMEYETQKFTRYDIIDGVQSREFSGGAYYKSLGGEFFFGGINGLNYYFPDSIQTSSFQPHIVITSVKILNEDYRGIPSRLSLDHNMNFLTFEFASMDFSEPRNNTYEFKLEGFDKDWQLTGSDMRQANYTNLPPGSYTFRVRGSNSEGVWSADEATLSILISPPFWLTWWFIASVILLVAGLIYYISTMRIKNLLAIEKLKTKLAADLHDNIGSGLTEISILSELAAFKSDSKNSEAKKELRIISELSRQLVDNMSDIVWVVNPQRDSLHDLIVRLKNYYGETLNSLGITFKVSNLERLKDIKLPIDFKQNLYLILKEAINNAIKHSKCSIIQLDANARKDVIEVSVTDDGIGIDESNIDYGNGIKNIKNRAESIGGRVKWRSSPSQGTSVRFVGKRTGFIILKSFLKNSK